MTAPTVDRETGEILLGPVIDSFSAEHRFLSNFFDAPFSWGDRSYPTVEHAFQCMKTVNPRQREYVLAARTPAEAKERGQKVDLRPDWEQIKHRVMASAVRAKFVGNRRLTTLLVATAPARLVEGNRWHDREWGVCFCSACGGTGDNWLGRILEDVRAELAVQLATIPEPTPHAGLDDDLSIPAPMLRLDPATRGRILDTIPGRIRQMQTRLGLDETSGPDQVIAKQMLITARLEDVHQTMRACAEALSEAKEALIAAETNALNAYDERVAEDPSQKLTEYRLKKALEGWVQPEREDARLCQLAFDYAESRSKLLSKQLTSCESLAKTVTAASGGYR